MNATGSRQDYTALWVWVCVGVGVCAAALICAWACNGIESLMSPPARVWWCGVCAETVPTYTGSIGDAVVCGVCDNILAWD